MLDITPAVQSRTCYINASPFNLTEALSVTEWNGFTVGMTAEINIARGMAKGEVHTIWLGAKTPSGEAVVAFEVHVGGDVYHLTQRGVHHVVGDELAHRIH